jgi:hypothetical protein
MNRTYLIYGKLDGSTTTVFPTTNLSAEAASLNVDEVLMLEFKAATWDEAVDVKNQVQTLIQRVINFTV